MEPNEQPHAVSGNRGSRESTSAKCVLHRLLEPSRAGDRASRFTDAFIIAVIIVSIAAVLVETVEPLATRFHSVLGLVEVVSVAIFSVEYLLRIWSCTADPRFAHPISGRIRFALQPIMLIDLLSVAPTYLPMLHLDMRALRGLRLFRIFRVLRLGRYSRSLEIMGRVFQAKLADLGVILFSLVILLLIASSLLYYAEHEAQPEVFTSIPATMWWSVATLTTVGYGDMYPVTSLGKCIGSVVAVLGIGFFALPAGLLAAGFSAELERVRSLPDGVGRMPAAEGTGNHTRCPRCGCGIRSVDSPPDDDGVMPSVDRQAIGSDEPEGVVGETLSFDARTPASVRTEAFP